MNLYTEKQVAYAISMAFDIEPPIKVKDILRDLTPIELPSDEEIGKDIGSGMHEFYKGGFIEGAKWMRDKIQGGNK